MRTYQETLDFLYAQLPVFENIGAHAYKPGLERMEAMDAYFAHPHRCYKTIHVAGTNGKGSTSHLLASVLQATGLRVGLFTSPHLLDFSERIRVNGSPIEPDYVVNWTDRHYPALKDFQPSFFELATMMAFCWFAEQAVDVAIIEVGLGGRLDSTNVITPELSIITNVSYDHMQFLGDTLPQIAAEKAGIMKRGVPCLIGEVNAYDDAAFPERNCSAEALRKVYNFAGDKAGAPRFYACDAPQILWVRTIERPSLNAGEGSDTAPQACPTDRQQPLQTFFQYETADDGTLVCPLTGACQPRNANTVITALHLLRDRGFAISADAVSDGFLHVVERTHLLGRWQTLASSPLTIADTGHNEGCFVYLGRQLQSLIDGGRRLKVIFGMVSDKDIDAVLRLLPPTATYYFCNAPTQRALPAAQLAERAKPYGLTGTAYVSVAEALAAARSDVRPDDVLFVGGSNFVVAEAMKIPTT